MSPTPLRLVFFIFSAASVTLASTMAAVAKQVHDDEGDADHNPEPVFREPFHNFFLFILIGQAVIESLTGARQLRLFCLRASLVSAPSL